MRCLQLICPNKAIDFNQSVLAILPDILQIVCDMKSVQIRKLYNLASSKKTISAFKFIVAVDVLYLLNRIDYDTENGVIYYADASSM